MQRWKTARRIVAAVALLLATLGASRSAQAKGEGPQMVVDAQAGHLFVARAANAITMVDITSGRVLRTVSIGGPPFAMAVDAHTSRLFVITTTGPSGSFAVLDTRTGALLRTGPTIGSPQAIAVDGATNRAFVLSSMATVHVLNAQTGVVLHRGTTHLAVYTVAVAQRSHHIFVGGADNVGVVAVLDARTGALLHTSGGPPRNDVGGGPMAVDNQTGHVFALGDRGVTMLDAVSGRVVQTVAVGPNPWAIVSDERTGHVFVSTATGVQMMDARSGRVLHVTAPANTFEQLAIDERAHRAIAVATDDSLWLIDTRSGAVVHRLAGAGGTSLAVDEQRGRIFVRTTDGVHALNTDTGTLLHTITVGS